MLREEAKNRKEKRGLAWRLATADEDEDGDSNWTRSCSTIYYQVYDNGEKTLFPPSSDHQMRAYTKLYMQLKD